MKLKSIAFFLALFCATAVTAQQKEWVGTWAAAPEFTGPSDNPPEPLAFHSLRQIVQVSVGGDCLRLKLSNEFSRQGAKVKSVFIADALDSCDINAKTAKYLTFGGKRDVMLISGHCIISDVCKYKLRPLQRLAITINFDESGSQVTSHRGSRTTSYLINGEAKPKTSFAGSKKTDHWFYISAIDVPQKEQECIAIIGNSITDGRGSTTNMQNRWPDMMSKVLNTQGKKEYAVLNLGIGGNCVVRGGLSEPAVERFDRDILYQSGCTKVVVFEGINDLGGSDGHCEKTAKELITAYQQFIKKAHGEGLKIYFATITPFGKSFYDKGNLFKETARQVVNQWIRTNKEADGFIDFDEAMRDKNHPSQLNEEWQEDWLHLNAKGYEAMGEYAAKYFLGL